MAKVVCSKWFILTWFVLCTVIVGMTGAAAAQGVSAPALPSGLPWEAISIGVLGLLQAGQMVIAVTSRSGKKTEDLEKKVTARIDSTERTLDAEVKNVHRCLNIINSNLDNVAGSFTAAVNEQRLHDYTAATSCAQRHNLPAPPEPAYLSPPKIKHLREES